MTLPARLARTAVRWRSAVDARRALTAAVYGDCIEGHRVTARAIERGPSAVRALAGTWCAAILDGVPRQECRSGVYRPDLTDAAGEIPEPVAAPAVRWAENLAAAHARRDWPTCRAMLAIVPPDRIAVHLAVLLHAAADATITREDDRW